MLMMAGNNLASGRALPFHLGHLRRRIAEGFKCKVRQAFKVAAKRH